MGYVRERKASGGFMAIVAVALGLATAAPAGAITVNTGNDGNDFLAGDGTCSTAPILGSCTLRAAIQEANFARPRTRSRCRPTGTR